MKIKRIGVDLAKNVYQLHGVDKNEKRVWQRRLKRDNWLKVLTEKAEPGCEIGMEACSGAHHWARLLRDKGYEVKLKAPQFVRPYVKSNKNDARDAEAICEAMSRPSMCIDQDGRSARYPGDPPYTTRVDRTPHGQGDQIRGLGAIPCWLEDAENGLSGMFRRLLQGLWGDLREVELIAQSDADARRLQQLRGVGRMIATTLVAAVGKGEHFARGRQMSASLGLTPKQHSSGNTDRLLGISKRGDPYLRSLLIHGARSTVHYAKHKEDRLSQWVTSLAVRSHTNVAAVALANKTVRIAWAMLRHGVDYQPDRATA